MAFDDRKPKNAMEVWNSQPVAKLATGVMGGGVSGAMTHAAAEFPEFHAYAKAAREAKIAFDNYKASIPASRTKGGARTAAQQQELNDLGQARAYAGFVAYHEFTKVYNLHPELFPGIDFERVERAIKVNGSMPRIMNRLFERFAD